MKKVDVVFVVLVYANTQDIREFIDSVRYLECSYKIIIVNSYYNDESLKIMQQIAVENRCDFINVENKGYSYGNNKGIEFARNNYIFDFLVISNADIIVRKFDVQILNKYSDVVIGPKIITSTGKNQNPFYPYKKIFPRMENFFLRRKIKLGYYIIIALNKICKKLLSIKMLIEKKDFEKVYALHGSFIIFSKGALQKIKDIFDENIFLFSEEVVLAEKMKECEIYAYYSTLLEVYHKEDGSMKFLSGTMYDEEVKSNTYVLKKYFSNRKL